MSYRVIKRLDGGYRWAYEIQDGTETGKSSTREEAVVKCIRGARVMNGTKITPRDIDFGHEQQVVTIEVVNDSPPRCPTCGRKR